MITIIHGENVAESRKYLFDLKQKNSNFVTIEGTTADVSLLTQAMQSNGLFEENKQIFIEELLSKRKASRDLDAIINQIDGNITDVHVTLWESKELTPKQLRVFAKAEIKKFDFPKEIFHFLDSLLPGNARNAIQLFHKTLQTEEAEFIFFMIVRHFRILLAVSSESQDSIDEVTRLAPWQKSKLQKQSVSFEHQKLLELYKALFAIETGLKTGKLAFDLTSSIDFFLSTL